MAGINLKAEGYRVRAVELRMIAEVIKNPENKARLLGVADDYDEMAEQIERYGMFGRTPQP